MMGNGKSWVLRHFLKLAKCHREYAGGHGSRNGLAASSGGCACLAGGKVMVGQAPRCWFGGKWVTSENSGIRQSAPGIYQGGMFQGRSGISSSGDVPDWQEVVGSGDGWPRPR